MVSKYVRLTCGECKEIFLLEAAFGVPGEIAKETPHCETLNRLRHGETFAQHKHQQVNFKWEPVE